jgi:hypothetical protein
MIMLSLAGGLWASCSFSGPDPNQQVHYHQRNDSFLAFARSGDIVLRCGKDEISRLFCRLNRRNQHYSHCGVLSNTDSGLYVTHIIGGSENPEGGILYEPVRLFIRPEQNSRWALIRYDLDSTRLEIFQQNIHRPLDSTIRFDAAFDLATDDKMYCSELLYKGLIKAAQDSLYIRLSAGRSGKQYIAIDDLFENRHCKIICEVSYK